MPFFAVLNESIHEGLRNVLGEHNMYNVLFQIGAIPLNDPNEFHLKLFSILGIWAIFTEKWIVEELFIRLNIHQERNLEFDFAKLVKHAEKIWRARLKDDATKNNGVNRLDKAKKN